MTEGWGILDGTGGGGGTAFSDDFNRANATTLGSPWTNWNPYGSSGTLWSIFSNTARAGAAAIAYVSDTTADGTIEVDLAANLYVNDGLAFRINLTDQNCFLAHTNQVDVVNFASTHVSVTQNSLRPGTGTYVNGAMAAGDRIRVVFVGSTLDVYRIRSGVTTHEYNGTMTGNLTQARFGLYAQVGNQTQFDNFTWAPAGGPIESWD